MGNTVPVHLTLGGGFGLPAKARRVQLYALKII